MGEYIAFVDSDDTVTFNYHHPMLECADKNASDAVFNDRASHTERSMYCCMNDSAVSENFVFTEEEALASFLKNEGREHSYFVLWKKLFRTSLLRTAIKELASVADRDERYNYSEDTLICFFVFMKSKRVENLHTGYYLYRIHNKQTVNANGHEGLKAQILNMSETLDIMESHIKQKAYSDKLLPSLQKWRELMSRTHFSHAKANKYIHLYRVIKERYRVNTLQISKFADSRAYSKNMLLPKNLRESDSFLPRFQGDRYQRVYLKKITGNYRVTECWADKNISLTLERGDMYEEFLKTKTLP